LLKHVHELVAAAMVTIVAVGVAIGSLNSLNEYTALTIATGGVYARAFGAVGGLSELAFVAWLLVKGVRVPASTLPVPA
jgi:hypothetical protein